MVIDHNAIINNWNYNDVLQNANTIILGSFNPYNPQGENPDYYYGRRTNYLWTAIEEISNLNPTYFLNNVQNKLEFMLLHNFCFLDVIDSIEITEANQNNEIINQFVQKKIFTEFSDQVLFTTTTKFENTNIVLSRNYNENIVHLINQGNIQKIIHTMGNNTIQMNLETKTKEYNLGINGFQGYINSIVNTGINFIPTSYSPSGRAVRVGGHEYMTQLKEWLNEHLNLNN